MAHTFYHNIGEAFRQIQKELQNLHEPREARALTGLLLEHYAGIASGRLSLETDRQLSTETQAALSQARDRLMKGEPIQYILGIAHFYGRAFKVGPAVLIPRQETEELAHWVLGDYPTPPSSLLDMGTGSGCLAITLSLEWNNRPEVLALDLSEDALSIARENAVNLGAQVKFLHLDLFDTKENQFSDLDVIVSNPPYVTESEKADLAPQVLNHEPATALFVPDSEPLRFYQRIAYMAQHWLRPGGKLYVEINEALGPATVACFEAAGYSNVVLRKDLNGKDRMLRAEKG